MPEQPEPEPEWWSEPLGIGSINQLNDYVVDKPNRIPLGFPIPKGDLMGHPYRERHTVASTTTKDIAGTTQRATEEQTPTPRQSTKQAKKGRKKAT